MKVVRIQGGLGNQLFCLAFARSVVLLTGAPVALDLSSYGAESYGRRFTLTDLARDLGLTELIQTPWRGSRPRRLLGRLIRTRAYVAEAEPPARHGDLEALARRGVYFDGYWQNEAFIVDMAGLLDALRREIRRRAAPAAMRSTVIHYRTYKEERAPRARGVPGPEFFRLALERIAAAGGSRGDIALVSDDTELALKRLGDLGAPVLAVTGGSPWDDLALMTAARNLILTNSSFSWWGGICADAARIFYPVNRGFAHYPWPAGRFTQL